jgi:hypothetical protein
VRFESRLPPNRQQVVVDIGCCGCCCLVDVRESDHIAQLFAQITQCESVLVTMEEMLQGFRTNLGGISQEIKALQNDSLDMNVKLANRRAVNSRITTFLEKVAVSEDMIVSICEVRVCGYAWDPPSSLALHIVCPGAH